MLAVEHVFAAIDAQRKSEGLSVNDLARSDGLIALQRVSQFNKQVDKMNQSRKSAHHQFHAAVNPSFRGELESLNERSLSRSGVILYTAQRLDPDLEDSHNGQSADKASVVSTLYEFARKLDTLGVSSREDRPIDYREVVT